LAGWIINEEKSRDDSVSGLYLLRHLIYDLVGSDAPSHRQHPCHSFVAAKNLGLCKGVAAASQFDELGSRSDLRGYTCGQLLLLSQWRSVDALTIKTRVPQDLLE